MTRRFNTKSKLSAAQPTCTQGVRPLTARELQPPATKVLQLLVLLNFRIERSYLKTILFRISYQNLTNQRRDNTRSNEAATQSKELHYTHQLVSRLRGAAPAPRWFLMFRPIEQEFPDKQELHRNMLGLLGNVAEVKALRPQLLTPQFITVFR